MVYILLLTAVLFILGYRFYGNYLASLFQLDDRRTTPAHELRDDVDYMPSNRWVLLGHHFSTIAGAGPIVGPIIAGLHFGWLPTLLWILIGAVFIGGVHDFSSVVASIRHQGKSLPAICKKYMNPVSYRLFLGFIWFALVYILTVFADLTATTFVKDGSVSTASTLYIFIAVAFGYALNKLGVRLWIATGVSLLLMGGAIVLGQYLPFCLEAQAMQLGLSHKQLWYLVLIVYCFVASITPVWVLLQPRDYLSSYLLYFSVAGATIGILFGGFEIPYPAFVSWNSKVGPLFPILFITVACGACSGFHSIVSSGTTSKQLSRETDARPIGYGAMLVEGVLAVIALCALMMLNRESALKTNDPMQIYASGMGKFLALFGIPLPIGQSFGALAISTFILTTLDSATRLGRYIVQEFFSLGNTLVVRYLSTLCTLFLPIVFVFVTIPDKEVVLKLEARHEKGMDGGKTTEELQGIFSSHQLRLPWPGEIKTQENGKSWLVTEKNEKKYYILNTGKGLSVYKILPAWNAIWPVFGATNQLLAALALLTIIVWLKKKEIKYGFLLFPALFMMVMTLVALVMLIWANISPLITGVALILLVLDILVVYQSAKALCKKEAEGQN